MLVKTKAIVYYTCSLNKEDEQKVLEYSTKNQVSLKNSIDDLYSDGRIDLYEYSTESDFTTDEIIAVEVE